MNNKDSLVSGFQFSGICAGIKKNSKLDLGLIYTQKKAIASAIFTKNTMAAAPIQISREHIKHGKLHAIIVNSGNANCFTGEAGLKHANDIVSMVAEKFSIKKHEILIASTGIIGKLLPFEKIKKSFPNLIQNLGNSTENFSKSILTTDTFTKEFHQKIQLSDKTVHISGYAKGSGMIAPNMATMLGFIVTDANITKDMLFYALKTINEKTFNAITVDGCTSTNDMVAIMANANANNKEISTKDNPDFILFYKGLECIMQNLSKMIVRDGEGAKEFIEIHVQGAKNNENAKEIAFSIANSNLVKTANYKKKLSLGRVIAAIGSLSHLNLKEDDVQVEYKPQSHQDNAIVIQVFLKLGSGSFTTYTCDLTSEYIAINNHYI